MAFSLVALLFLLPLLLPVVIILRFTGEGEVFYQQDRVGQSGKVFGVKKFATMLKDSPNLGTGTITVKNDTRVLPVGKILRKTKINELPQLINILYGEMSLIGPRPLSLENFKEYNPEIQTCIKKVKPGLSGVGSIVFRNEENLLNNIDEPSEFYKNTIAPYKGEIEKWFTENNSLKIYFLLIFVTILVVLFPKSKIFWRIFYDVPKPKGLLKKLL